jgi:hypothetical protein
VTEPLPTPKSVADVDPNFERQLRALKADSKANGDAIRQNDATRWFRPAGWDGDVFDYAGIARAFNRDAANEMVVRAISDAEAPGTSGDLIAATTQIDYLACLERAFRVRHAMPVPRLLLHAAGTMKGNGTDKGVFMLCGVEYVRRLVAEAKQGG